jgi:hypothetical protein
MDHVSECGVVGLCINLMQSIMLRTMYELCPMYELRTMYHMNGHILMLLSNVLVS